ncbi:radical SAM protein [Sedimentibacter hydroxybenzoicus DSM 7310]|uniref:Radical SAM protein n=1 Tax=Sedimentibacter hydroxybenzoicus DSM 7310 TaxID=1123245 RepID=A0A974BGR4_SEDHY|nr:radical SAM protein [Sedimentibacter hydroxybenzoicus]NYB72807.1 radical SAM protein [Sedimentibacter hydroxybenzoicus DSM 7310]
MKRIVEGYELSYIRKMGNFNNHETENELIVLLPVGCYWAKKNGGCSYCGYQKVVDDMLGNYESMTYQEILKYELDKQTETIHRLSFFVAGSFFEIPRDERIGLFEYLNNYPKIKEVYIESRPELITEDNIRELKNVLNNKVLSVAIGLETSDEKIRNEVHNKGVSNELFVKAMEILKREEVNSLIYVFVKPPVKNITDEEALTEAYNTVKYSFDNGATAVELECGYIVENSKMYDLYMEGKYKTLSLWTIRDLLLKSIELNQGNVRLAYFHDTPAPIDVPKNCPKCNDEFLKMFDEYRATSRAELLLKEIDCECMKVG